MRLATGKVKSPTVFDEFRAGGRTNSAPMTAIAAKMSDKEIKAVTDYAAGLR